MLNSSHTNLQLRRGGRLLGLCQSFITTVATCHTASSHDKDVTLATIVSVWKFFPIASCLRFGVALKGGSLHVPATMRSIQIEITSEEATFRMYQNDHLTDVLPGSPLRS